MPVCRLLPSPRSKVHEIKYLDLGGEGGDEIITVSTEDGRVVFFSTKKLREAENGGIPYAEAVAQLGGRKSGLQGRTKDFEIMKVVDQGFLLVTGGSDGTVRVWWLTGLEELTTPSKDTASKNHGDTPQIGKLLGFYETGNRITCLKAFVMLPAEDPLAGEETEAEAEAEGEEAESSSDGD